VPCTFPSCLVGFWINGLLPEHIKRCASYAGTCWPGSFFVMRTGGPTKDHIGPQTGSGSDRFLWVEYAQFRPNVPLGSPTGPPKPRLQKRASALQEYFEQLMVCKCESNNEQLLVSNAVLVGKCSSCLCSCRSSCSVHRFRQLMAYNCEANLYKLSGISVQP
jgi:hypothetical protein